MKGEECRNSAKHAFKGAAVFPTFPVKEGFRTPDTVVYVSPISGEVWIPAERTCKASSLPCPGPHCSAYTALVCDGLVLLGPGCADIIAEAAGKYFRVADILFGLGT